MFLRDRGFDAISDYRNLSCPEMLSSGGVEDRCMVDALLPLLEPNAGRPFFFMGWTTQTHHPYEPTPGVPLLDLVKEPVQDEYDLGRYLNVLHETDRQIGRIFDALRRSGLNQNTIVIVTGDHGQAFGYPHDTYIQGRTVYEEDVNVPLMIWSPKLYRTPVRSGAVGSLIDLAPTIADVAGLPPAPAWQGRSLFDSARSERAYLYVAEDHFTLGVREGNTGSTSSRCGKASRSCTTLTATRPSSTTWRARSPNGARGCGSASRRGQKQTAAGPRRRRSSPVPNPR